MGNLRGKYAIVGAGETPVGKLAGRSTLALHRRGDQECAGRRGAHEPGRGRPDHQPADARPDAQLRRRGRPRGGDRRRTTPPTSPWAARRRWRWRTTPRWPSTPGCADTVVCVHARNQRQRRCSHGAPRSATATEDFEEPYGLLGAVAKHAFCATRPHARVRHDQRAARRDRRGHPQARLPERQRHDAQADHARGPPEVPLDRRAAAPARLLAWSPTAAAPSSSRRPSAPAT